MNRGVTGEAAPNFEALTKKLTEARAISVTLAGAAGQSLDEAPAMASTSISPGRDAVNDQSNGNGVESPTRMTSPVSPKIAKAPE
jgi:hypothetical protein